MVTALEYIPEQERYITTGQNSDYLYIKIHRLIYDDYFALSKNNKGEIHIAHNNEYIAKMFFVPAFKHPTNHEWYLCPIKNLENATAQLNSNSISWEGTNTLTCYQYSDLSQTGTATLNTKGDVTALSNGRIKITSNITIQGFSPEDTGFAYLIFPTNPNKYRYVRADGINYDLVGTEQIIPIDKKVEFLDTQGNDIKHFFNWNDMTDTGNRFMQILTIEQNKGLLVGTYGYGAGNNIYIDPTYQVDYSPIPAKLLTGANVNDSENLFNYTDITTEVSDNNDSTNYETHTGTLITNTIIDYTDNGFESQDYLGSTGDKLAVDFDLKQPVENIQICVRGGYSKANAKANLSINDTTTGYQFNFPTTSTPNTYTCINPNPNILLTGTNRIGVACVSCSAPIGYTYVSTDTTNPDNKSYTDFTGSWTQQTTLDWAIKITYNYTNTSNSKVISSKWNKTYNPTYDWYLRIKKLGTTGDPHKIKIYAYHNETDINITQYKQQNLTGTGWFNINVSDLLNYETNIEGFNYTILRFYGNNNLNISEIRLRAETNDTQSPVVHNCWVNNATVGCDGTATWICNITDNVDVNNVDFTINSINYTAIQNNTLWYYSMTFSDNITVNETFTLTDVYAYDLVNNLNHSTQNINIQHDCLFCNPDWIQIDGFCQTNDSFYRYYYDNNSCNSSTGIPVDNNTWIYCNYCSEDLFQILGTCQSNGTQTVDYYDNNYFSCCSVTGLPSDCTILTYPYNTTTIQNCTFLINNFTCSYDPIPFLTDKMNVQCEMPDNKTYCCVINIYKNWELLQSNPEYRDASDSIINLRSEEDTRTCFIPEQKLMNGYYRPKNLEEGETFIMEVKCTSNQGSTIIAQYFVTPEYRNPTWLITVTVWAKQNVYLIILGFIIITIIAIAIGYWLKKIRGQGF